MKNSQLTDVFFSLSNKEVKDFRLFVRSPYYNKRKEVVSLFDYLVENKDFSDTYFTKEKAWKYVFSELPYEDSQMRYTMSFLLKTLKDFLIQNELNANKTYSKVLLCRALRQRGVEKVFQKEMSIALGIQDKHPFRNAYYHFNNYLLHVERVDAISSKTRNRDPLLQQSIDELTFFYISDLLRQSCSTLTVQAMMKKSYSLNFLPEVLDHVLQNDYSGQPAIEIYFHVYRALSDLDNEEDFDSLKILLIKHWSDFPPAESRNIYLLAINCCIKRLNKGNRKYIREGFELYKSGLENKILLENGVLSKYTYDNVLRLGLALKEFEWVEFFLKNYKPYLPAENRENIFTYGLAVYYFQKPDYESAMDLLQKVEFKDVLENLDARRMLLRIYYELKEYQALESLLDSFKVYIGRQKNIGYHKDDFAYLIFFMKKILKTNLSNKAERLKLKEQIESTSFVTEKAWLLEQLK